METQTRADIPRFEIMMACGRSLIARGNFSQLTGKDVDELSEVKEMFTLISRFKSAFQASQSGTFNSPAMAAAETA